MTAVEDVEEFARIVRSHDGIANFGDPCPPELIEQAQSLLGFAFPPSYRRFLELIDECDIEGREFYGVWRRRDDPSRFGGALGFTLEDRQSAGLPPSMLVVRYDGMGGSYVIDTAVRDEVGEAPVRVIVPPAVAQGSPGETVAPSFGRFALDEALKAIGGR